MSISNVRCAVRGQFLPLTAVAASHFPPVDSSMNG